MAKANEQKPPQCEGMRRYGGAFTLGPVRWVPCENPATVTLRVVQDGKAETLPACQTCWEEAIDNGIKITDAKPIGAK